MQVKNNKVPRIKPILSKFQPTFEVGPQRVRIYTFSTATFPAITFNEIPGFTSIKIKHSQSFKTDKEIQLNEPNPLLNP